MKKVIRVFLLLITLVMWSSVAIGAQDDSAFSDGTKLFFDLDGDKKNEEIYINNNKLYIDSRCVLQDIDYLSVEDLFQKDKYKELFVIKRWGYADCKIYRYKGKKLVLYDKLPGLEQWNAIKGKKVLNRVGYITGTNGKGRVIAEIHIEPPTIEMWDMTYFRPEYIIKSGKVQMVEKEYQLWSCNIKAAKDWNAYEKASLKKSNKKLFVIKKGTKCIANRIKVTPKYTFIRFVVKGTKKIGWSIFPTSQMEFHA